jgi:hypothetical protein
MRNVIDRDTGENGRLEEIVASDSPILSTPDRYLIVEWAGPIAHDVCTARTVGIARLFVQNEVNDPEVTDISVHDLDDDGREIGDVVVNIERTFRLRD